MKIQAIHLGENKIPERTALYEVRESRTVVFEEKPQKDGSIDRVVLQYQLTGEETGYFSKEFRPPNTGEEGTKKIDITAVVADKDKKKAKCYLYDVKGTYGGRHVLLKLWDQWNSGWQLLQEYLVEPSGCRWDYRFGVFTRKHDRDQIEKELRAYRAKCEGTGRKEHEKISLAIKKGMSELAKNRKICEVEQAVLDGKFWLDHDPERKYEIEVCFLTPEGDHTYQTDFLVKMG